MAAVQHREREIFCLLGVLAATLGSAYLEGSPLPGSTAALPFC
ncbi:hypothetical protein [uncultured Desulfovibrio sp.]|nr:hypothetical protein [uncultured Desulfovibrio sp.]